MQNRQLTHEIELIQYLFLVICQKIENVAMLGNSYTKEIWYKQEEALLPASLCFHLKPSKYADSKLHIKYPV